MFKSILVAIDVNHETSTQKALEVAVGVAKGSGAELHLLGVVPDFEMPIVAQYFPSDFEDKAVQHTTKVIDAVAKAELPDGMSAATHVTVGRVHEQIIKQAKKLNVDLIVVGAHTKDLKDYLVGSNASRVVRHASQSVLVVRV